MKEIYKLALMDMACRFGETSYAERLKVGSLIFKNDSVIALGCNGQPPGWHTEVCEDEEGNTLSTVRHSEDAALQKLWNSSETADGAEMFISHKPCLSCSIKIVTAGIRKVYYRHDYRCNDGIEYLLKHGLEIEQIN
jgi:dCMP deaminase